jgi:hypothetical protein
VFFFSHILVVRSGAWMMGCVQGFQALTCHMSINLGRGNVGVPQEHLHYAQVGPVIEQMGGKSMAQNVRGQGGQNPGLYRVFLDDQPKGLAAHAGAAPGNKDKIAATLA